MGHLLHLPAPHPLEHPAAAAAAAAAPQVYWDYLFRPEINPYSRVKREPVGGVVPSAKKAN